MTVVREAHFSISITEVKIGLSPYGFIDGIKCQATLSKI